MVVIIGADAFPRQQNAVVALIGVDGSGSDAGVGVDAAKDEVIDVLLLQVFIQRGAEEGTVALLDDGHVACRDFEVWMDLRALCSLDHAGNVFVAHFQKGVA